MIKINKKFWLFVLIFLVIIFAVFSVIYNSAEKDNKNKGSESPEREKTLFTASGTVACLPIKNNNIPHNDLCVLGLKDDNNNYYYRLQSLSDDKNNVVNKIKIGQKQEVSGELLDEKDDIYEIKGVIKVRSISYLGTDENGAAANLPESFKANYISFQNYRIGVYSVSEYPRLEFWVENGEIECNETPAESSLPIRVGKKEINGKKYCIGASSEGAAGSIYTQYAYATVIGDNVYSVGFVARYPHCDNYPEEKNIECQKERETFNLDVLVDQEVEKIRY